MVARMKLRVKQEAKRRFKEILSEGKERFGARVANRLYQTYRHSIKLLEQNPYMGQVEPALLEEPECYRGLCIHEHYKLIYRIERNIIYVVDVWDTRREPRQLVEGLMD